MHTRIYTFLACAVLTGIFLCGTDAQAMVVRWGESFTFEPYATTDGDLYAVGENISMRGTTTGDVLAAGKQITQNGIVQGDGLYLGGTLYVEGVVNGDVRGAAGKLFVTGVIEEDLVFAGGMVTIDKDAVIKGDILIFGDFVTIEGTVEGTAKLYARTIELKGQMNGVVDATADEALSIVGDAHIMSDVNYSAPREAFISDTARIEGEMHFTEKASEGEGAKPLISVGFIMSVLVTVISALIVMGIFPKQGKRLTEIALRKNTFVNGVYGFILFLLVPIFAFVLLITLVGMVPAAFIFFLYLTSLVIAYAVAPVIASVLFVRVLQMPEKEYDLAWVSLGAAIFALLGFVPILGGFVRFIVFLLALYATFVMLRDGVWQNRKDEEQEGEETQQTQQVQHEQGSEENKDTQKQQPEE